MNSQLLQCPKIQIAAARMEVTGSIFLIKCIDYIHKYIPWNVYLIIKSKKVEKQITVDRK